MSTDDRAHFVQVHELTLVMVLDADRDEAVRRQRLRSADTEPTCPDGDYPVLRSGVRAARDGRIVPEHMWHTICGKITTLPRVMACTLDVDPQFYPLLYCAHCRMHRPTGAGGEFHWCDVDDVERQSPRQRKVGT